MISLTHLALAQLLTKMWWLIYSVDGPV